MELSVLAAFPHLGARLTDADPARLTDAELAEMWVFLEARREREHRLLALALAATRIQL